jgi:predicted NAD-dependent protein-ADP-ribosyltransferase YbiA (DUF1768 family)
MIDKFKGKYAFLSNFYPCKISYNGIEYPSVEHAFQAQKADNNETKKIVAKLQTAGQAKRFGKSIVMLPEQ